MTIVFVVTTLIRVHFGLLDFSLCTFRFLTMVTLLFIASLESIIYLLVRIVAFYLV